MAPSIGWKGHDSLIARSRPAASAAQRLERRPSNTQPSGTTSGTIQWACATVNSGGTPHTYFCNYIATSSQQNGAPGDSGSPVYFLSGNTAHLTGLMWGAGSDPWNFAFAPLGSIQNELGIVPYCQGFVGC